jgi:hypothetical protein
VSIVAERLAAVNVPLPASAEGGWGKIVAIGERSLGSQPQRRALTDTMWRGN